MSMIIRLQNLPRAANSADIRQYFQGLSIRNGGVFIVGGEKSDAFILFSTNEDVRQAMLLDNGCIKGVQIRLLMSSRNEMQNAIETIRQQSIRFSQNYIQHQQPPQLPITGSLPPLTPNHLSPKSSEYNDRDDKSDEKTKPKSSGSDGNRNGSRLDRSRSRDCRRRRFDGRIDRAESRERHRKNGGRNSRSPVSEYSRNGQQQSPGIKQQRPPETAGPGAAVKRNDRGPSSSTSVPVLQYSYKENLQFKHKSSGGGGKQFSKYKVGNSGGGRQHHRNHLQNSSRQMLLPPPPANVSMPARHVWSNSNCVYLYGLPTMVTDTDIIKFFQDISVLPVKIHIRMSMFGWPAGDSYCEFGTAQQAHVALSKDHCLMGSNRVYVESITRWHMIQAISKPMQHRNNITSNKYYHYQQHQQQQQQMRLWSSYYGGGPYSGGCTSRMRGANTGSDGFGQPGCVVTLDNVPYRANVQDIVDFFYGFELNSLNVIRRFNRFGNPTGEMRVNLKNPQEAMRAIRTLQNKPVYNRPVYLTLL